MRTVFISHSKYDEKVGEEIDGIIQEGGYVAFRFQRDMRGGKSWQQQLPARIKEHKIFLYIATAYAHLSEICQKELQHAVVLGKPLVTVTTHPGWIPPSPLDDHQAVFFDGTGKAVARLMEALQGAEPLDSDSIPEDWKTWDGRTRRDLVNSGDYKQDAESERIRRDLNVVEKREILQSAVPQIHSCFATALAKLADSDSRIQYRIGDDTSAGFSCFIDQDGALIKGCRVYISAGFSGITYDGNTHSALQWEIDDIRRQIDETKLKINENLQAVYDGSAVAAAFVRSLDKKIEGLRVQLRDRMQVLNQSGNSLRFLEGDNSYKIQSTLAKLDAVPVLEVFPSQGVVIEVPDSNVFTIENAAEMFTKVLVDDLSN